MEAVGDAYLLRSAEFGEEGRMNDGFKIHEKKDGRVLVVLHPTCSVTREEILALLAELGIDEAVVTFLLPEEIDESCADIGEVPVVIPIDQATCDEQGLDTAAQRCGQAGGRVIVVFGDGFSYDGLHPIADKYGTQCGWSADQLRDCVENPDAPARDSGKKEVVRPEPQQVKCG